MKKMHKLFVSSVCICFALSLQAQEKRKLSLNEAVQLGLQNSKVLKIDAAKIKEATANLLSANNNRLPGFKVTGSALALANANVDLKVLQRDESERASPKANSAFYGNVAITYPLYAGGRIRYGIQSAEYLVEAAKLSAENDMTGIAYNVSQAYNNLFKSSQAIKVLQENLAASQKRDSTFLRLENNGIIARNDRLKANLLTSNIELQLLEAQNNFKVANINMDLLLGLSETILIDIDEQYITEETNVGAVESYLHQAYENRKDLRALEYQKKSAVLGIKAAKAETLPSIALTGGYLAADVPKILTVYNAANIGIGIQYNVDNLWKKNASILQAQARQQQLQANSDLLNDQIKLDVNRDYQNALYASRRIEIYQKAADQANENYRVTKRKFDNGLVTITDLLDADTAQIAANVNVINAKADGVLAYRKLLQTTGILTTN